MKKFTDQQIKDWLAYERVRLSARHNMWSPQARAATRLSNEDYLFCIKNFEALQEAALNDKKAAKV